MRRPLFRHSLAPVAGSKVNAAQNSGMPSEAVVFSGNGTTKVVFGPMTPITDRTADSVSCSEAACILARSLEQPRTAVRLVLSCAAGLSSMQTSSPAARATPAAASQPKIAARRIVPATLTSSPKICGKGIRASPGKCRPITAPRKFLARRNSAQCSTWRKARERTRRRGSPAAILGRSPPRSLDPAGNRPRLPQCASFVFGRGQRSGLVRFCVRAMRGI